MSGDQAILEKLHPVYQDFLLMLRPLVDSARDPFEVTGIPLNQIAPVLRMRGHDYEFRSIGDRLESGGLVKRDEFGFYQPTARGAELIRALSGPSPDPGIPPLPPELGAGVP